MVGLPLSGLAFTFVYSGAAMTSNFRSHVQKTHASAAFATIARTVAQGSKNTGEHRPSILVGTPLVHQHLTMCNAYSSSLEVMHTDQQVQLTVDAPLKYKECKEFAIPLAEGDHLDFRDHGRNVGTFRATTMPKASASLLLIVRHRHGAEKGSEKALTFESHAFADLSNAQIAVVDAYRGNATSVVHIIDNQEDEAGISTPMHEALRFNTVAAIAPGQYDIALMDNHTAATSKPTAALQALHAPMRSKCVVMRVGGDVSGVAFPQELVVFPKSRAARDGSVFMACLLGLLSIVH